MRRILLLLLAGGLLLLAGCSQGEPKAPKSVTPKYNFGDVPVVVDMSQAKTKQFFMKNEGTGDLKLSSVQVKTLQGC